MTQKPQPSERSSHPSGGGGPRQCAISGCRAEATHAVFEAAVDPDSGEAILRADPRLPRVCATHAGMAGRLSLRSGVVAGVSGAAFLVPRLF
jgi:hypothetical protein